MEHITFETQITDLSKIIVPKCYENYVNKAIASSVKLLTIKEFIDVTKFNIHNKTFDILFMNINDEGIPIYIDAGMLNWMGYNGEENKQKQLLKELLERNFEEDSDYKYLKNFAYKEYLEEEHKKLKDTDLSIFKFNLPEPTIGSSARSIKHLIVMPDTFRSLCMMINTEKGKQIRKYYITLEKLIKAYNLYQTIFRGQEAERAMVCKDSHILEIKNMILEERKKSDDDRKKSDERFQRLIGVAEETKTTLDETKTEVLKTNHKLVQAVIDRVVMGNIVNKEQQSLFIYKLVRPYDYEYLYYGIRCQNKSINPMLESRQKILNKARSKKNKLRLNTSLTFVAKIGHTGYIPNPILFWKEFVQNTINIFENYKYCKFDLCVAEIEFINILKSKDELRDQNIQEL